MGFSLKKLGRGVSKIVRKNKRGFGKLVKTGLKAGVSLAAPVLTAKAASVALGAAQRVASAPARRRAIKEKEQKISKALAADIKRPALTLMSSRETAGATAMPGGGRISSPTRKSVATAMPGGATIRNGKTQAPAFQGFIQQLRAEQKQRAASDKAKGKQILAEQKRTAAAAKRAAAASRKKERAAAAAARKSERAEKKAQTAANKKAGREGTFLQSIAAGALGVKVGKGKGSMASKVTSATKRRIQSIARTTVRKSPGLSKAIPGVAVGAGVLAIGGKALDANAAKQVQKAEKKLGRKLTTAEVRSLTTPKNTFSGK